MILASMLPLSFFFLQETEQDSPAIHPFSSHQVVEVQANSFTGNRQVDPALAVDDEGRILTAWGSRRQEMGTFGVFAQLLDPLGRPLGTETHVNQHIPGHQRKPATVFDGEGHAWIAWNSIGQDGDQGSLMARRFKVVESEEGTSLVPVSDEFFLCEEHRGDQMNITLTSHPQAGVLACWSSSTLEGTQVRGRIFAANGTPRGDSFSLATAQPAKSVDLLPSAAVLDDAFVVVWARHEAEGRPLGIHGRLLPLDGEMDSTEEFVVWDDPDAMHLEPCVDSNGQDRFAVAWMSSQAGVDYFAHARVFNQDAEPLSGPLDADAGSEGYRTGAVVAMAEDGRFVVAYNDVLGKVGHEVAKRPEQPTGIRAVAFTAASVQDGNPFKVNVHDEGEQTLQVGLNARHVVWTSHDQLILAWHGNTGSDHRGIGVTLFAPDSLNPPPPPTVESKPFLVGNFQTASLDAAKPVHDPFFVPEPKDPPRFALGGLSGFQAFQNTGWYPPDPELAVGADNVVCVVNGELGVFDKDTGNQTVSKSLVNFWSSVGAGGFVFDPIAVYDDATGRFFVAAADGAGSGDAICLAVTKTGNPNDGWNKYRFSVQSTCTFLDFPNMGLDANAIYIAGDCFSGGGNRIFIFDKQAMIAGQSFSMKQVQSANSVSSTGASENFDTSLPAGYFATTYAGSSTQIQMKAVTDPLGNPTHHAVMVNLPVSYKHPPDADQLGTSNKADTIDYRIKNGVVRNGSYWLCHNTGAGTTARVRWYEFDLQGWPFSGNNPVVEQYGTLNLGVGEHNWFGDISVDDQGNAVIAFNRSSSNQYISVEYATRKGSDPDGEFSDPEQLQISTSPETGDRWGDYGGVDNDPVNPGVFWSHHEYRTSSWRTWVGSFSPVIELSLSHTALIRGGNAAFLAEGAQSGERVWFAASPNTGSNCYAALGGLCIDLGNPVHILGSAVANNSGLASLTFSIPSNLPAITVYSQAAAMRGVGGVDSMKSNRTTGQLQ